MTKWLAMLMACLAFALVAAGCGDDDDDGGNGGGDATEEPAPAGGGAEDEAGGGGGGETAEVSMQNIAFSPDTLEVKKGTTVTWTNDESVGHDVTKTGGPGPDFSSGDPGGLGQGDTFEQTFNAPGKVDYVCSVHPNMTASITVTE